MDYYSTNNNRSRMGYVQYIPPEERENVEEIANRTADDATSVLQSEEFKELTPDKKIEEMASIICFMENDIKNMANIMETMTNNMNKLIQYIESMEMFMDDNFYSLRIQVGKVKEAGKPIIITGGNNSDKKNHGMDKAPKTESL